MTIRGNLIVLRDAFFELVTFLFRTTAKCLGFPENPGMPMVPTEKFFWNNPPRLSERLPDLQVRFPPSVTTPKNLIHVLIGDMPKPVEITKYFYENDHEGYYNFYFVNYKSLVFLPNWFSEFLQIRCHFCIDLSILEVCREMLFLLVVCYYYLISIRIVFAWFVTINPYTIPFSYIIGMVDWIDDVTFGLSPHLAGVSLTTTIFLTLIGKVGDSINYIVFTMPYLPSEGVPAKAFVDGKIRDVLLFRYLPILWYKHPIPNSVREFWFNERPDILLFLQKAYENVDIQFLPDRVLPLVSNLIFHGIVF